MKYIILHHTVFALGQVEYCTRVCLTEVVAYGQIPVPLVYFAVSLVGEQWTESEKVKPIAVTIDLHMITHLLTVHPYFFQLDIYYPIFMTIKFLFYFGWLRSAETLYNPFGEDDDDFEINDLLDRHFRVALAMVDDTEDPPVLPTDIFLDVSEAALMSFYQEAWAFKVGFS